MPISNAAAAGAAMIAHKRIPHRLVRLMPGLHPLLVRFAGFEGFTVPALELDGHKLQGTRRIARFLDEVRPEPPLFPAEPEQRARVEEAERWGEQTFQPIARRLLWPAIKRNPGALASYSEHSKLPLPAPMIRLSAPMISRVEMKLNAATPEAERADLAALPEHLDRIDGWIAEGLIGGETPNAADLQIASTLRLMMTLEDLRALIEPRPAAELALRLFPQADGHMPAGSLPV